MCIGVPYQLEQIASEANNQPKLSTFLDSRNKIDSPNVPMTSDNNISEVSESVEDVKQSNQGSDSQVYNEAPSASEGSRCSDIQNITESPSIVSDSSNKCHSTSLDPNFVETYFKVKLVFSKSFFSNL